MEFNTAYNEFRGHYYFYHARMTFNMHEAIRGHYCPACGSGNVEVNTALTMDGPTVYNCLDCDAKDRVIHARHCAENYWWTSIVDPMVKDADNIRRVLHFYELVNYRGDKFDHNSPFMRKSERICAKLIKDGIL